MTAHHKQKVSPKHSQMLSMLLSRNKKEKCVSSEVFSSLLVHPGLLAAVPLVEALGEPVRNLSIGGVNRVRAMADVPSNLDTEVTADGSHCGVAWHCGAEHLAALKHYVGTFPDHGNHRARSHVLDEPAEELLGAEVLVVLLHVRLSWGGELHGDELVALGLKALDDFPHKAPLHAVRLDHNVCALHGGRL
mmetsp:Transcript_29253/g.42729  ORF Transcript_29253/g.42729 Transcript_29253/m.42729 type:complete len:191 (-) Transcript_29253:134-706(-)